MSFKPEFPHRPPTALAGFGVLSIRGDDAAAFLQAQTMNDVLALAPGHWHWNGWLTPKGRVIALFALLRLDPGRFLMLLPDMPAAAMRASLQRYVFRSKVAIEEVELVAAAGAGPAGARGDLIVGDTQEGLAIDMGGDGGERSLWLLPPDASREAPEAGVDAAWRAFDIAHGLPRLGPGQQEAWTPQMLSLERLAAFSLKKGCYPGQEIVSRTHYLGQAKRRLARVKGEGLFEGAAVAIDGAPSGTVVCVTSAGDEGLAVLVADAPGVHEIDGRAVTKLPLNGGLARVT